MLQSVTAVILMDSDSNRLLAKYYEPAHTDAKQLVKAKNPFGTLKEQRAFEAGIFEKTRRVTGPSPTLPGPTSSADAVGTGDVLLYAQHLVLYKPSIDLTFFVIGPENENELMLQGVLNAFFDAVSLLLRHQVEKRAILENLDLVVLALDETVDNGSVAELLQCFRTTEADAGCAHRIILETDSIAIASRVSRPKPDAGVSLSEITINEQSIMAVRTRSYTSVSPH
jgi:hypothetical protein